MAGFTQSGLLDIASQRRGTRGILSNKILNLFGNSSKNHNSTMHNMMSVSRRQDNYISIVEEDQ
jgi:hypothetical protein